MGIYLFRGEFAERFEIWLILCDKHLRNTLQSAQRVSLIDLKMALVLFTPKKSLKMNTRNLIWRAAMKTGVKSHVLERNKHKRYLLCWVSSRTCDFTSVFMAARQIKLRVFISRDFLGIKRTRDIFKPVRETRRADCNVSQTCMSHPINHISKRSANSPPKKINSQF